MSNERLAALTEARSVSTGSPEDAGLGMGVGFCGSFVRPGGVGPLAGLFLSGPPLPFAPPIAPPTTAPITTSTISTMIALPRFVDQNGGSVDVTMSFSGWRSNSRAVAVYHLPFGIYIVHAGSNYKGPK